MTRIAVVIPTYRRPELLLRAIRSAFAAGRPGLEISVTVVDNHSPEDVAGTVRSEFGDRVLVEVNERNIGVTGNWNRCREVGQSSGADYWMLLEDDNYLDARFFELTMERVEQDAEIDVVFTACEEFSDEGERSVWRPWSVNGGELPAAKLQERELLCWAFTCPVRISAMVVRSRAELIGLPRFTDEHYSCQDVSGLLGLMLKARAVTYIDEALMSYYINPRSVTASARTDASLVLSELLRAFRQNIEALLAARQFGVEAWVAAALNAPVDRLMLAVLALHLAPMVGVSDLRRRLTSILVDRSGELGGVKRMASRVLGKTFWTVAGLRARRVAARRRFSHRSADFDSRTV